MVPSAGPVVPATFAPPVFHTTGFLSEVVRSSAHTALGAAPQLFDVLVYTMPSTQISADGRELGGRNATGGS